MINKFLTAGMILFILGISGCDSCHKDVVVDPSDDDSAVETVKTVEQSVVPAAETTVVVPTTTTEAVPAVK